MGRAHNLNNLEQVCCLYPWMKTARQPVRPCWRSCADPVKMSNRQISNLDFFSVSDKCNNLSWFWLNEMQPVEFARQCHVVPPWQPPHAVPDTKHRRTRTNAAYRSGSGHHGDSPSVAPPWQRRVRARGRRGQQLGFPAFSFRFYFFIIKV